MERKIEIFTLGQSISKMGDRIYSFILPVLYAYYFMNPYAATIISGGYSCGGIIGSSLGVKFSDKLNYRVWPIYLNIIQGMIALVMTIMLLKSNTSMYVYGTASFLLGISLSLLQSFNGKYIYSLGSKESLKRIAGIRVAGDNFGVAIGALLSGIVITYKAFTFATTVNAITFFISAVIILLLNRRFKVDDINDEIVSDTNNSQVSNKKSFLTRKIKFLLLFNFLLAICTQPSVFLVTSSLIDNAQEWKTGLLISSSGIFSAIIGYIIYKYKFIEFKNHRAIFYSWIFFGLAFLTVPMIKVKIAIVCIGGIWAFSQTSYLVDFESLIVSLVSQEDRGKLFANVRLSRQLANPIGFAFAGYLISNYGGSKSLSMMMSLLIIICFTGLLINLAMDKTNVKEGIEEIND